jgi:hypothetical protein
MKTNFLNKLKQGLFLLIAVLGTFVGFSQSTQNPTIGGSKTPDTGGLRYIGGGKSSDGGISQFTSITDLTANAQCSFPYLVDIEGGGKGTSAGGGQLDKPDDMDDDTVGNTIGRTYPKFDIGGRGGRGTDEGTGQIASLDDLDTGGGKSSDGGLNPGFPIIDIGGRSQEPTFEAILSDIGGRDSGGGYLPFGDIGGRGDVGTGLIFDTGGKTPGGIGFYEDGSQSKLSKIERYGCVLRPQSTTE